VKRKQDVKKLRLWQQRLADNQTAYQQQADKMGNRESLYQGVRELRAILPEQQTLESGHIRNIVAELIEGQVDSNIPQPKVTARRQQDELKAKLIEDMLRNELDRINFEEINDLMSRTVPIQGGGFLLVEWDNSKRTHNTIGEVCVSAVHPKQVVPQDGVYSGIEDMDYIILKLPQTKEYIRRRYGVDVDSEGESEPDVKSAVESTPADDLVTQYIAYYRNDSGGIGLYSWVNDTQLEDLDDYQARRLRKCAKCGATEPLDSEPIGLPSLDGSLPIAEDDGEEDEYGGLDYDLIYGDGKKKSKKPRGKGVCPYCGADKWEFSNDDYELVYQPIKRSGDLPPIPGAEMGEEESGEFDESGKPQAKRELQPTKIPYYKPDVYPVILQKNVSLFGQFLGESDVDKIEDQQNTTSTLEQKIIDKLLAGGSYLSLPDDCSIEKTDEDLKVIRPGSVANANLIHVFDIHCDINQDLGYLNHVYEEARQEIGITDSFQGRKDPTATSGVAKEFSAQQSAGRLESKRVMKKAAFARLFELIFKFKLAYADEPRPVVSSDNHGNPLYQEFNRYDFLEQDEAGEWYWNDQFLFGCDTAAPLANNRAAMWQEVNQYFRSGAFGDPSDVNTMILFWSKMELLHYPGAADTKRYLEEELQHQQQQQMPGPGQAGMMPGQTGQMPRQMPEQGQPGQALAQMMAAKQGQGQPGQGQQPQQAQGQQVQGQQAQPQSQAQALAQQMAMRDAMAAMQGQGQQPQAQGQPQVLALLQALAAQQEQEKKQADSKKQALAQQLALRDALAAVGAKSDKQRKR